MTDKLINIELSELMFSDGFPNVSDAVLSDSGLDQQQFKEKTISLRQDFRKWQSANSKIEPIIYFNHLIGDFIKKNDISELNFFKILCPNVFVKFYANDTYNNFLMHAMLHQSLQAFKWYVANKFKVDLLNSFDENGCSILMIAATRGEIEIANELLSGLHNPLEYLAEKNYANQTAEDLAVLYEQKAFLEWLKVKKTSLKLLIENSKVLKILPDIEMTLQTFVNNEGITPKGWALMLHYFSQKKSIQQPLYLLRNLRELARVVIMFSQSAESTFFFLLDNLTHRSAVQLQKLKGNRETFIIMVDSVPSNDMGHHEIRRIAGFIKAKEPGLIKDLVFLTNNDFQQTDDVNCTFFALKNLSKMVAAQDFLSEVLSNKTYLSEMEDGMVIGQYTLPARFMHLSQSYDSLNQYIKDHPKESKVARVTKDGKEQNLSEYAFHPRENYGVETPLFRKNRNVKQDAGSSSSEPKYVEKNLTIDYFAAKYCKYVIPRLFNSLSEAHRQDELKRIILEKNTHSLMRDPETNKIVVKK